MKKSLITMLALAAAAAAPAHASYTTPAAGATQVAKGHKHKAIDQPEQVLAKRKGKAPKGGKA